MPLKQKKILIIKFKVIIDGISQIKSDAIYEMLHQSVAILFFKIQNKILPNLQKNIFCRNLAFLIF